MRRASKILLGVFIALIVLVPATILVYSRTDVGRERARRIVVGFLHDKIRSDVKIGRIEGDLLGRFSLVDVMIPDQPGRPFLTADRITASIAKRSLFSRQVLLTELALTRPVFRLSKPPDGPWNYQRILSSSDTVPGDSIPGFGDWIELRNVTLTDGSVIVQRPWTPHSGLTGAAADSAIKVALSGESRARVQRVSWGYQQTMEFTSIDALFPSIIVSHPDSTVSALRVDRLKMVAAPFNPPAVRVDNVRGDVRIGEDTILVQMAELRLPGSRVSGTVHYIVDPGDALLSLKGDSVSLADLRLLYPPLPDSGGGSLDLNAAIRYTAPSEYVVTNARMHVGTARVEGTLGLITTDDSIRFRATDLRLVNFPTSLVERLVPGVTVATPGVLTGRAQLDGPATGMQVAIDATFDPDRDAPFRVVARGGLGIGRFVSARQLDVRVEALPVTFLRNFSPNLPVGGTLFTEARLNGSTGTRLAGRFTMTHRERGALSRVSGEGSIAPRDAMRLDVGLRFDPVSLALATDFDSATKLQGDVTGTGRVRGPIRTPSLRLDLALPTGTVVADGDLDFSQSQAAYSATIDMRGVDVHAIDPKLPVTTLNGITTLSGIGTDPASMSARVSANFREIIVDSTQVQELFVEAVARNGLLQVDTLRVRTSFATADAGGTIGLVNGHDGKLVYRVDVKTIAGLARWISTGDTGQVYPRPGVRQRVAELVAQQDSAREAQRAAQQDLAALAAQIDNPTARQRRKPPELPSLPRDSIGGALQVSGDVAGNLERYTARGTVVTDGLVWAGSAIAAGRADFTYADARTPEATATVEAKVDSVRAVGFAFDSAHVRLKYHNGDGDVDLTISPRDTSEYHLRAEYVLRTGEGELRLKDLTLRIDTTTWETTRPSTISWRGRGVEVDSLEIATKTGGGRIFVNGTLPDGTEGNLVVAVDSLRLAPWLRLLESDISADAVTTFNGRIEGTSKAPRMRGALALHQVNYAGSPFPDLRTSFAYDRQRLSLDGDLRRDTGGEVAHINGTLPLDLSLSGDVESRIIDAPFAFNVAGDSIPLAPFGEVTPAVTGVNGRAAGSVSFRGTLRKPRVEGDLALFETRLGLPATGVTYTNLTTRLHMHGDSLLIDSLSARSGGTIEGSGSIQLTTLTNPVFNIAVKARDVRVLNNNRGELFADAQLKITGPLDTLGIHGTTTITRGVVRIPDPETRGVISTGDLAILEVDSTTARELDVTPPSKLFNHMNVDVNLSVARGTWARSADANVEIYGDVRVRHDPILNEISLTGSLLTEQGDYTYLGHRFVVTRGSARFTGEPTINPVLQVMANYEVRQAGRPPLEIRVVIAGTLEQPRLTLESNARPALSQSDLISFLAFGTSSSALLTSAGSGVSGGGQTGASLAGNVAALATRQLTGVALGAMMEQVRGSIIGATRADIVNITPADLPADLSVGGIGSILKGTELQVGKYVDRRTFLLAQVRPTNVLPGATLERRLNDSVRLRASFETRFQPQIPSLSSGVSLRTLQVVGGLVTWSLKW